MLRNDVGNFLQAFVARNMPIVVVKKLEVVYIYKNHGQVARCSRLACIFSVQSCIKLPPVGYARECVCNA